MIDDIKFYFAKDAFKEGRAKVYGLLAKDMMDRGGGRKEMLADKFERWAKRDRERKAGVWLAYAAIAKKLRAGRNLADSLTGFIPKEEQIVIAAGETSGNLGETLTAVVKQEAVMAKVVKATGGALVEPGVVFIGFYATSVIFGKMIWPALRRSFPEKYWDSWTAPMIDTQIWISDWWVPLTVAIIALVIAAFASRPVLTGRARMLLDYLPPWSGYRDQMAIKTLVMLAQLVRARKTLRESIETVAKTAPKYLRWHLLTMKQRLNKPRVTIEQVFGTGLFNMNVVDLISDASQGRDFDAVLDHVANAMLDDIVESLERRAKIMNMVGMAIVISLLGYATMVQVIGVQTTAERFTNALQKHK